MRWHGHMENAPNFKICTWQTWSLKKITWFYILILTIHVRSNGQDLLLSFSQLITPLTWSSPYNIVHDIIQFTLALFSVFMIEICTKVENMQFFFLPKFGNGLVHVISCRVGVEKIIFKLNMYKCMFSVFHTRSDMDIWLTHGHGAKMVSLLYSWHPLSEALVSKCEL